MQSPSEQPLVGEERYVTTLITAAKETIWQTASKNHDCTKKRAARAARLYFLIQPINRRGVT